MTTTQNTDRAYTVYRCTENSAWSTSGNLTAEQASVERDRQSQELGAHVRGVWIEIRKA